MHKEYTDEAKTSYLLILDEEDYALRDFPICSECAGLGLDSILSKIFPTKQMDAVLVRAAAKKHKEIEKVYVFGSAITNWCRENSDIDIGIVFTEGFVDVNASIRAAIMNAPVGWCDVVVVNNIRDKESTIKSDVLEGVVIYECSS